MFVVNRDRADALADICLEKLEFRRHGDRSLCCGSSPDGHSDAGITCGASDTTVNPSWYSQRPPEALDLKQIYPMTDGTIQTTSVLKRSTVPLRAPVVTCGAPGAPRNHTP